MEISVFKPQDQTLSLTLRDGASEVATAQKRLASGDSTVKVDIPVRDPRKWTAETPHLYELEMALVAGASPVQTIKQKVGFRKVEIKKGILMVNGRRILLRGTNRHDHHPRFGRAVPLDFMREDLLLMKRHNINALRSSHYPGHPRLFDMADELGLWVMDEADLECHGFYDAVARPLNIPEAMDYEARKELTFGQAAEYTSNNAAWRAAYVDRMTQLVQRDKNHASIIIWSLGNEAFYGANHAAMYAYAKDVDPGRPVHYEGDTQAQTADMYSYMYPSMERLTDWVETAGVRDDGSFDKPVVLCEYGHAMGNGPGWLEDYQALFRVSHPGGPRTPFCPFPPLGGPRGAARHPSPRPRASACMLTRRRVEVPTPAGRLYLGVGQPRSVEGRRRLLRLRRRLWRRAQRRHLCHGRPLQQ